MIAPCYFGTESAAAFDFKRIGAEDVAVTDGRVAFRGGPDIIAAANLWSRCAERVLILLKTYKAVTFDELFDGVAAIPWEELLPADAEFPVKGSSLSSTLSSVPACQSIVKKAVVERLKRGHRVQVLPEDGALYKIRFSIRKNMVEVMLDTSGDGLHKRGYRKNSMEAPIKETLAAAIIDLGRIYPDTLAQDPFCGSGTLMIEAAMKAMNMAPGLRRRFTAEHYAFLPAAVWKEQREKALSEIRRRFGGEKGGLMKQEYIDPRVVVSPQDAFYAEKESLPLMETAGRICSEFVMCYPPGIPILAPGEEITEDILNYIVYAKEKGCSMTGPEDAAIERLNVLKGV